MTLRLLPSILVYLHRYISPYIVGTTEISETLGFFLDSFTHYFDMGPCHYSSAYIDPTLPFLRSSPSDRRHKREINIFRFSSV